MRLAQATIKILSCILLLSQTAWAKFDFNQNCQEAYRAIFELKLKRAEAFIEQERKVQANNGFIPLLENYLDYFYLLSNESKSAFDQRSLAKKQRLSQIAANDKNSPFYLYAQAEINLQWALIRGRYGEYFAASREINRANSLLKENQRKYPNFILNQKGLGLINVVIGALPDGFMKSTLSTFGIKGNVQTGLTQLEDLANKLPGTKLNDFYDEVVFYYAYLLSDVAKSSNAYAKTMQFTADMSAESLLKTYLQAYVSARNGKTDAAITLLENRPKGSAYSSFAYLDYLLGVCKLNQLNWEAKQSFLYFLQKNNGVNYIKDSYLHLAWIALLNNDSTGYQNYINKVKDSGSTYQYQDKQALEEAKGPRPNKDLLRARLLWDGGYYSKALNVLVGKSMNDFSSQKDQTEFHYRVGRIFDSMGKDGQAISHYQSAINLGRNLKYYYAAKSAVLLAHIYQQRKDYQKAQDYYKIAITMEGHEHETSIEQEANAGLKQIGKG